MDDDFRVAAGMEAMSERLQFRDQFLEVVDLAVEHDADAAIFVVQRLLPRGEVDDRQTAVPQPDARLDMHPALHRSPMKLRFVHAYEHVAVDFASATGIENSGYSAHRFIPSLFVSTLAGNGRIPLYIYRPWPSG